VKKLTVVARRADAFCARLNDGLAAAALALAILNAAMALHHNLPSLLALATPTIDPETGVSISDF
jgi:hypothetical protein